MQTAMRLIACIVVLACLGPLQGQPTNTQQDPFAGIADKPVTTQQNATGFRAFFADNFGFRREVMSQFTIGEDGRGASRQSVGFEVLKKFSTSTATIASLNFQGRMVRRDGFNPVQNDMEGERRPGWFFEYHNVYLDIYNIFNPVISASQRSRNVGRFNLRAGRFYVPFGLNLQTDTHGPVLQLSNDRNFGFERDWYTGLWGSLNRHLNYDAYYLLGSGYDLAFKGQRGLAAVRISLANKYSSQYGIEAGVSALGGERLAMENHNRIETRRTGIDVRYRRPVPKGLFTLTHEFSAGSDFRRSLTMQLHQADYLQASRRWGIAAQYRRHHQSGLNPDASLLADLTWYFRNDIGNSTLHWFKLSVERRLERSQPMPPHTVVALQYYFYR